MGVFTGLKGPEIDRQPSCLSSIVDSGAGLMETDGHHSPGFSATAHNCITQICSYAIGKLGMIAR